MNKRGNPETLVASHPGNVNAVKQGIHSSRLIQARAAEIAAEPECEFPTRVCFVEQINHGPHRGDRSEKVADNSCPVTKPPATFL